MRIAYDHQLASELRIFIQGQYEIVSLSGSYIRGEHGGKTGGLSVCLSSSDGEIFGGGVGGLLKAAGPVQVSSLLSYSLIYLCADYHTYLKTVWLVASSKLILQTHLDLEIGSLDYLLCLIG